MKKSILKIGKALNKAEQKQINGGYERECLDQEDCDPGYLCHVPSGICESVEFCQQLWGCE